MAKKKASPEEISARICNDVRALVNAHLCDGLDVETTKHALQHVLRLWGISNARNRYRDCKNWSKAALALLKKNKKAGKTGQKIYDGLYLEHVVPVKLFLDELLSGSFRKTDAELSALFEKFLITTVLTEKENEALRRFQSRMPDDSPPLRDLETDEQVWARYREACAGGRSLFDRIRRDVSVKEILSSKKLSK